MRKNISVVIKWLIVVASFVGVILALFGAELDGYSNWSKRLLYFTTLSNVWIGIVFAILAIVPFTKKKSDEKFMNRLYIFKYIFTVSITITGLVFCSVLAPFAEDGYRAWSVSSLLTHVFVPAFSIIDFFLDNHPITFKKGYVWLPTIPPFLYFIFASILGLCGVDFGRGEPFPYFFLYFKSPAGIFGFSDQPPFIVGSFYWVVLLLLIVLGFSALYKYLHPCEIKRRREKKLEKNK